MLLDLLREHHSRSRCGAASGCAKLFLYTNIRLRHQRNKTTVGSIVPSHLLTDYNSGLLVTAHNCSSVGI